jgi:predicted nuclease of restriction endonuclease-like RecB superfamily
MLKSELIRPRLRNRDGQVWTQPIPADYHYLTIANQLITLFKKHIGQRRAVLGEALRDYEGNSLDYPVIRGLAAVLESRCIFNNDPALSPVDLRTALFRQGPVISKPDLFNLTTREQVLAETAAGYGLTVEQLETALFADLAEEQILLDTGEPVPPGDLIAHYNLELARGLLYWAREMRVFIQGSYKDVFRYIKLFKLMYTIQPVGQTPALSKTGGNLEPAGEETATLPANPAEKSRALKPTGYHITLHGPLSPFVKSTIRYGLQFAKFLPALLLCQQWRMEADVHPPGLPTREPLRYTLDDRTDLRTHFKGSGLFDSQLEADFAAEFEEKYGGVKRKWDLVREDELIVLGDTVMIPDFSFTHRKDGRRALLEIVGFWHPHYLRRKLAKVREAGRKDLILLVYESVNVAEEAFRAASPGEVLTFSRKPVLKEVLAAVERCAIPPQPGPIHEA